MNEKWLKAAVERFRKAVNPKPPLRGGPGLTISDEMIVAGLRAALDPLQAAQWLWSPDGECAYGSGQDAVDYIDFDEIVELRSCVALGTVFAASVCLSLNDDGDCENREGQLFLSEAEAMDAWPKSLAAVREGGEGE